MAGRASNSLLREIQAAATEGDSDVATLLRKCKVLAMRLANAEFKQWVDSELNGYKDVSELPPYRIMYVESKGKFSGPMGGFAKSLPLPLLCIENEEVRERLGVAYLMQPISSYASLISTSPGENAVEHWPSNLVAVVAGNFYGGWNCIDAWKVIPYPGLVALVDTIKTRVLNFVLEIEVDAPDAGEAQPNQPPLPQERVSQVFHMHIAGNVQNVSTGGQSFNQTATAQYGVPSELFQTVIEAISQTQADPAAIRKLTSAVNELSRTHGGSGFAAAYKSFLAVFSDHVTVFGPALAPYMPALLALLPGAAG